MEIESIRTWQWMLIGVIAGVLFSCILAATGPAFDGQARDTIEQGEFENGALALTKFGIFNGPMTRYIQQYHKGQPLLKDVTVHPPIAGDAEHRYWVTGRAYFAGLKAVDPTKVGGPEKVYEEWKPFKYPASVPYAPGYTLREEKKLDKATTNNQKARNQRLNDLKSALGGRATFPTVVDYLKSVATVQNADFSFKVAWWEKPALMWFLPAVAGFLMIGVAWPLTLSSLQGFGLAKPIPTKAIAKPLPEKKRVRPLVPPTPTGSILQPTVAVQTDERKYGGEFYPVVKTGHKDDAPALTSAKSDLKPPQAVTTKLK